MGAPSISGIFNTGDGVLGSQINSNTGVITLQTGDVLGDDPSDPNAELWQQVGFVSLPALAQPGKASCQTISLNRTTRNIVVATRDTRAASLIPAIKPGETFLFAGGPNNSGMCNIYLQNDGSSQTISMQAGTVNIAGSVNLSGASDFAALAAKVNANFQAIVTALAGATDSLSKPITVPPITLEDVSASNVKIS